MKSEARKSGTFWTRVGSLAQRLAAKSPAEPPLLVRKVEEDVTAFLKKGQRAILSVPVHFETLDLFTGLPS